MDGTYKVLVVEDDSDQANLIQQSLLRFDPGFRVETATSGKACLRKLNANRYQAVVLDVHLPDLNSLSLLSKITSNGHNTPVVVVSGRGSEETAVEALKNGACDYLIKDSRYLSVLPKVVKATIENHHRKAAT
ncbi:MAG: response regulator, partial [Calditrichaeota bacterium]